MSILVYLKKMPFSRPAVRFAALFAHLGQTSVAILQVQDMKISEEEIEANFQQAESLVRPVETQRRLRKGPINRNILEEIRTSQYEMVVLRARRAIRYRRRLGKKVARLVAIESRIPVLVVKDSVDVPALRRILVCTGGKPPSNPVIQKSIEVAKASGAAVTLLHVISPVPSMYTGMGEMEETFEELLQTDTPTARHLRQAAELFAEQDVDARLEIHQGDVIEEILSESESGDYDLVIIGAPSGDNRLKEWMMGDVTRGLVNLANPALLIVR